MGLPSTSDVLHEGDLTEAEIAERLPKYLSTAEKFAMTWWKRFNRKVELDEIMSAAYEGAWRGLCAFECGAGSSEGAWVRNAIWMRCRMSCLQFLSHRRAKDRRRECEWPANNVGELLDFECHKIQDPSVLADHRMAKRLIEMSVAGLGTFDAKYIQKIYFEQMSLAEAARHFGVKKQAVHQALPGVLDRFRMIYDRNHRRTLPKRRCSTTPTD